MNCGLFQLSEVIFMEDTIAAISTAYGEGGIGIIRISGENALSVLKDIFKPLSGHDEFPSRKMVYGKVIGEKGSIIDEALAVYMKGPKTYTAEDVVEINCHGSMVSLRKTLALVLRKGARLAEPGEFTKRAFLNGRLDLSQAEAVMDIIKAKTEKSFDVALSQLEGGISKKVKDIRKELLNILVNITVNIDYPDEDIEELTYEKLKKDIMSIGDMIGKLLSTASAGRMIKEGIRIAIVGKPNVGKSSLMNGLLRESRAIVTDIPGTTRDTIEESVSIKNIPIFLIDTAGIRETSDKVEKLGIEKSKEAFNNADFIIFILDGSEKLTGEDENIIEYLYNRNSLVLINKNDLGQIISKKDIEEKLPKATVVETSLIAGKGIKETEDIIENLVYGGKISQGESVMVNNIRHIELLQKSSDFLNDAYNMAEEGEALEFIEIDIKSAYEALGEIIGETVSDDIINEVFSRFCLGK